MVVPTKNTLGNNAAIYLRDLLRNTIVDPNSSTRDDSTWVYVGYEEKSDSWRLKGNLPRIYIFENDDSRDRLNIDISSSKINGPVIPYRIEVWADSISDRATVADAIVAALSNPASTDGTTTLKASNIVFKNARMRDDDSTIGNVAIRKKIIFITFRYRGS